VVGEADHEVDRADPGRHGHDGYLPAPTAALLRTSSTAVQM